MVTGIATSYYDSIPVLYITGNQTRNRVESYGTRQYGFQCTPVTEIVRPITKYAVMPMEPEHVIPEIEKALKIAKQGRPGPVVVDICDDLQRAQI